jgi:hypothetical protein
MADKLLLELTTSTPDVLLEKCPFDYYSMPVKVLLKI